MDAVSAGEDPRSRGFHIPIYDDGAVLLEGYQIFDKCRLRNQAYENEDARDGNLPGCAGDYILYLYPFASPLILLGGSKNYYFQHLKVYMLILISLSLNNYLFSTVFITKYINLKGYYILIKGWKKWI